MQLKTKRSTNSPRIQFEKLKDPKIVEVFQAEVGGKFAALCIVDSDTDTLASSLKEGLLATAEWVLGRQKTKIQPWITKFWISAIRDSSCNRSTQVLKKD